MTPFHHPCRQKFEENFFQKKLSDNFMGGVKFKSFFNGVSMEMWGVRLTGGQAC